MERLRSTAKPNTAPNSAVFNWAIQVTPGFPPCISANATEVAAIPPAAPIDRPRNCKSMPRMNSSSAQAPITNSASPATLKSRQSKRTPDGSNAVHSIHWNITAVPTAMTHAEAPTSTPHPAPRRFRGNSPNEVQVRPGWRATPIDVTASVAIKSGIALRAMRLSVIALSRPLASTMATSVATSVRLARSRSQSRIANDPGPSSGGGSVRLARSRSQSRCLRRFDRTGIEDPYFTVHALPRLQQQRQSCPCASLATHLSLSLWSLRWRWRRCHRQHEPSVDSNSVDRYLGGGIS